MTAQGVTADFCRTNSPSSTHEAFSLFMMASYKETAPVRIIMLSGALPFSEVACDDAARQRDGGGIAGAMLAFRCA